MLERRVVEAAERIAKDWLGREWADPPLAYVAPAADVLVRVGRLPEPPDHPATRVAWQLLCASLKGDATAFAGAMKAQLSLRPKRVEDAPFVARPAVAAACAHVLLSHGLDRRVDLLLPDLRLHPLQAAGVLQGLRLEEPRGTHLRSLAEALLRARDGGRPWAAVEDLWARLVRWAPATVQEALDDDAFTRWEPWFEQRLRELARSDVEAAIELLSELRSWTGLSRIDTVDSVLKRVDPQRAWQLVGGADGEDLTCALAALCSAGPLVEPAVQALDERLAELDCVSDWDEWMMPMHVAASDGQLDLVQRELERPELAEEEEVSMTALELASSVGGLRARGGAADQLFELLATRVEDSDRDRFLVAALR